MWIPPYRTMDSSLPDVGTGILRVKSITPEASDAIFAATDVAALASLRGYLRSYAGPSGGLVWAIAGAFACWAAGYDWFAAGLFGAAGAQGYVLMEIRRHARMWEALVEARLAQLVAPDGRVS